MGKPERMHEVAKLITRDSKHKIVVLSALSGTTNTLVQISDLLAKGDRNSAKETIEQLHQHYLGFINQLVSKEESRETARQIIAEHFEFLHIILRISFSEALNKDILAQGELMSTKLFSVYLSEMGIQHELLPALEFMSIDANEEPQLSLIMITSPMVIPDLRLIAIANTSVPSSTPPPLIDKPIPAPKKKPPNTETNKLSFVISGNSTK